LNLKASDWTCSRTSSHGSIGTKERIHNWDWRNQTSRNIWWCAMWGVGPCEGTFAKTLKGPNGWWSWWGPHCAIGGRRPRQRVWEGGGWGGGASNIMSSPIRAERVGNNIEANPSTISRSRTHQRWESQRRWRGRGARWLSRLAP
jgi:hypothetical protein